MNIRLLSDLNTGKSVYEAGQVISVADDKAAHLIDLGAAENVSDEELTPPARVEDDETPTAEQVAAEIAASGEASAPSTQA